LAGMTFHILCGWCEQCNKPVFMCGHTLQRNAGTDERKP
jgi:hypothetical protein